METLNWLTTSIELPPFYFSYYMRLKVFSFLFSQIYQLKLIENINDSIITDDLVYKLTI